jgi:hypothetical protein
LSFGRMLGSSAKAEMAATVSTKTDFNIKLYQGQKPEMSGVGSQKTLSTK